MVTFKNTSRIIAESTNQLSLFELNLKREEAIDIYILCHTQMMYLSRVYSYYLHKNVDIKFSAHDAFVDYRGHLISREYIK
jgi:hypothetical protein